MPRHSPANERQVRNVMPSRFTNDMLSLKESFRSDVGEIASRLLRVRSDLMPDVLGLTSSPSRQRLGMQENNVSSELCCWPDCALLTPCRATSENDPLAGAADRQSSSYSCRLCESYAQFPIEQRFRRAARISDPWHWREAPRIGNARGIFGISSLIFSFMPVVIRVSRVGTARRRRARNFLCPRCCAW
jgi:hypothetical protein